MTSSQVGAYDAKTHLPRLLDQVEAGEVITITKHGRPVARLVPIRPGSANPGAVIAAHGRAGRAAAERKGPAGPGKAAAPAPARAERPSKGGAGRSKPAVAPARQPAATTKGASKKPRR